MGRHGRSWAPIGTTPQWGSPPYGITFSEWALSNPAAWAYLAPIVIENGGWAVVKSFERKRPARKPFPEHPRERLVVAALMNCPCCGSTKLSKLGEDVTETLEVIPRQWKVIQTVRERFSCRQCEAITQPPAPFHVTPRGFAGPSLLAMILFEKFGQHQPLNRQSERYGREGVELSLSTLADQVGACAVCRGRKAALIERHVLSAERLHGDDTTVPILAKGQTETGRVWVYVRDDRPLRCRSGCSRVRSREA